ncbi:MAG: hypothetical protein IPN72_13785 [Saprospiraceae bacterium]|nr:hypothetical protein [Saprospiraceae bacterium]
MLLVRGQGINNEQVNIYTKDAKYIPKMPSPPPPPAAPKAHSEKWGLPPTPPTAPTAPKSVSPNVGSLDPPTPPTTIIYGHLHHPTCPKLGEVK